MLKRFSHFFACLLLVLMPLQGFAAANMSVCNSMMQAATEAKTSVMPCHKHANMQMADMIKAADSCKHKSTCKSSCATLCASLSGMTAPISNIKPVSLQARSKVITFASQSYASITLPSPQRPPILQS